MTKYFLKVSIKPTSTNPHQWPTRIEYYGKRESPIGTIMTPSEKYLFLFGFGSYEAAENAKARRMEFYNRDDNKFKTFTHEVEIMSSEI